MYLHDFDDFSADDLSVDKISVDENVCGLTFVGRIFRGGKGLRTKVSLSEISVDKNSL